jgi:hypothetical protein
LLVHLAIAKSNGLWVGSRRKGVKEIEAV